MPLRHNFDSEAAFLEALEDWFAGQALTGMLATEIDAAETYSQTAARAYKQARVMLAERAKPTGNEKWTTEEILKAEG